MDGEAHEDGREVEEAVQDGQHELDVEAVVVGPAVDDAVRLDEVDVEERDLEERVEVRERRRPVEIEPVWKSKCSRYVQRLQIRLVFRDF